MAVSYDSTLLQLETLENEYHLVMLEYQQAFQDYLSVSNGDGSSTSKISIAIPKSEMQGVGVGAGIISGNVVNSVDICQAQCSADPNCSGATYNSSNQYCNLQSGDLKPAKSVVGNYAIVTKLSQLTDILKEINTRLTAIFTKTNDTVNQIKPSNAQEQLVKDEAAENLNVKYQHLLYDRSQLLTLEEQNMQLTNEYDITGTVVRQTNFAYLLWFLVALIIFIVAIKMSFHL